MNLFIVESPGKVKKIQGILGDKWRVAASVGHVRDLPEREMGVAPPDFRPEYVETSSGRKVLAGLRRLAGQAEEVWLATDPDREGEAIAWHLQESLNLSEPFRVTYTEITEQAIRAAVESPRSIDLNLVRAQEGRRVLDRLVGYKVSSSASDASGNRVSAGRVQTPALRLVVEREESIDGFRQTTHFGVELSFDGAPVVTPGWRAAWNSKSWLEGGAKYFLDKAAAERVAAVRSLVVASYAEGESRKAPPAPLTTSTLQQAASNVLKLDPKETMAIAQKLYEAGHITYMRTDSPNLSDEAVEDIRGLASAEDWPVPAKARVRKAKEGAQEAHEAIRPTRFDIGEAGEDDRERKLYSLIRTTAIASQLEDAVYATVACTLVGEVDGREVSFDARGRRLTSPGWKVLVQEDPSDDEPGKEEAAELDNPVPELREGAEVFPASGKVLVRKTKPPARYTQAALIRELERLGVGRPSTYASILDGLSTKGYVKANPKRQLEPTGAGREIVGLLKPSFAFADYEYTRSLEEKLDEIAAGKADYLSVVQEAGQALDAEIEAFASANGHACPDCGKRLRRFSRQGEAGKGGFDFWACPDREGCGAKFVNDAGKPGERQAAPELSDHVCAVCGARLRHLVKRGPGGYDFWGCSDRSCPATYDDDGGRPGQQRQPKPKAPASGFKCPSCKSPLHRRQGVSAKTGKPYDFYSCPKRSCNKTYPSAADGKPVLKPAKPK